MNCKKTLQRKFMKYLANKVFSCNFGRMTISAIKSNRCKHKGGCTNYPKFGAGGYCEKHDKEDPGYLRKKNTMASKIIKSDTELRWFYRDQIMEYSKHPFCMNCGQEVAVIDYGNAVAHVLPKSLKFGFPSVRTHPENSLFLGPCCGCHDRYDSSWENASKMNVWGLAAAKFLILYPLINPVEQRRIPAQLLHFVGNATQ